MIDVSHNLVHHILGPYSSFRRSSMCSNRLNHSIVIGVDGAARFIDLSACIGHHPSPSHSRHSIVGSILRNRSPRGDNLQSSDRIDREDVPHRGRPIARDDNNIQHRKANQTRLKKAMKDSNISLPSAIDSTPLYQLANAISPEDKQITHKKLRSFYEIHGKMSETIDQSTGNAHVFMVRILPISISSFDMALSPPAPGECRGI